MKYQINDIVNFNGGRWVVVGVSQRSFVMSSMGSSITFVPDEPTYEIAAWSHCATRVAGVPEHRLTKWEVGK